MKFIDPRTDFAFKKIFGNENAKTILISFLNAVLSLKKGHKIKEVEILNPYQAPKLKLVKETFVDVRCVDERGIWYIAEMQVQYVKGFEKRIIYNSAKAYANQIEKGQDYPKLRQVLSISVLDFILFDDIEDRYLTMHVLKEDLHNKNYIDEIRYYFIELPKFAHTEKEIRSDLEKWVFFIKNAGSLEVVPKKLNTGEYRKAFEIANTSAMSREEWAYYDAMSMKIQDEKGAIEAAYDKGMEKGEISLLIQLCRKRFKKDFTADMEKRMSGLSLKQIEKIGENIFEIDDIDDLKEYL